MGNTGSSTKISAQDRAILDLKIQRDKLRQYQKRITTITDREIEIARECLRSGNKQKAMLALRRKKYQESLLTKTDQQLAQLQALTSDVEFALVQKDVLFGLQQGTAVLKAIHKEMGGLDKVEMILSETEEAQAYQQELNEMLSGKISNEDEDEVEDELRILEQAEKQKYQMPDAPSVISGELPTAPQGNLQKSQETEEEKNRRWRERASKQQNAEPIAA